MVDIYVEYMSTVATLLGTKCNTTSKMQEIIDFEKQLAKVRFVLLYYCGFVTSEVNLSCL